MKRRSKAALRKRSFSRRSGNFPENHLRVIFTERQVRKRVNELAQEISRDYRGQALHVIGILENSFMFMADLIRALTVPVVCHFMKVEMRDRADGDVAVRELVYTPKVDVTGKDVLLVDAVLQSGVVQEYLHRSLLGQGPASLRTVTLIEKTDERKVAVPTGYLGFKTSAKFVVGYGLGHEDKYRNLKHLAALG